MVTFTDIRNVGTVVRRHFGAGFLVPVLKEKGVIQSVALLFEGIPSAACREKNNKKKVSKK